MREFITGPDFRDMIICAAAALDKNVQIVNELNVFPVPDGDTGTNMSMTINNAVKDLRKKNTDTVGAAADVTASAMLRGARGNSGVILSLLFRGLAKNLKGKEVATAEEFAKSMQDGVKSAYKAVMKPAEGTILTVSRVATDAAAEFAEAGSDIELTMVRTLEAAREALEETVNQNPVLKKAGVVDSGGKGYVIILEAMLASLEGRAIADDYTIGGEHSAADFASFNPDDITFGYCTEFIITRANKKSPDLLRAFLEGKGDSIVVVEDDEIIKVHVHTDVPGKVLTEALTYGSLLTTKIENMREQHTELSSGKADPTGVTKTKPIIAVPEKKYGMVAVCAGDGMKELFLELGADRVVTGGQTMNPSTDDILHEVDQTPAEIVFLFPNNKNIIMAAEQCVGLSKNKKVIVVPTKTVPQGISAMLALDENFSEDECADAMKEAMVGVHTALITYAARDSDFDGYHIKAGEYLGLYDGALIGSYPKLDILIDELRNTLSELEPDLISVYYGEDVNEDRAQVTTDRLAGHFPDAEVSMVYGGQPVYYYMISAE